MENVRNFSFVRIAAGVLALLVGLPAAGVETKVIRDDTFSQFNQGESTGTELLARGRLRVAPSSLRLEKTEEGVAWDVAVDPFDASVFFSTGHGGKVYRYVPGGKTELWADLSEVEALAVAVDPTGAVLVGASPGGKIYRVVKSGKPELFFDTKEQYVWDLIFDRSGVLYAATGPNGKIFRIRGQNNGEVYYDSEATNVMAMNFTSEGKLLAATQGKAFIFRFDAAGKAYVLNAPTEDECRSLAVDSSGNIYAAVNSARAALSDLASDKEDKGTSIFGNTPQPAGATPTPKPPDPSSSPLAALFGSASSSSQSGQSTILQIQPSGFASVFWTSPESPVQSIIPDPFGNGLLVAAGKKGKIYHLDPDGNYSVVGDAEEPNVLSMAVHDKKVYFTTANKASLYSMASQTTREGLFASRALNAAATVKWGNIFYEAEETSDTEVAFETRSGNTPEPEDKSWSAWIAATRVSPRIVRVQSPVAQYLQYRLTLRAGSLKSPGPVIDSVQAFYVQQNVAPLLKSIDVDKIGGDPVARRAASTPAPTPLPARSSDIGSGSMPAALLAAIGGARPASTPDTESRSSGSSIGAPTNSQKLNITWSATDPNGDKLRSRLYYKGEDENVWKEIEKDLTASSFQFSTEAIPDGKYRFKVEVSDAGENPEDSATTADLTSRIYVVDNSPPEISNLRGEKSGKNTFLITASASDKTSIVAAGEYNIDAAKEWKGTFPEDDIFDLNQENFRFTVTPEKESPEHTLSLRVYDREGNSKVEKVLLK